MNGPQKCVLEARAGTHFALSVLGAVDNLSRI